MPGICAVVSAPGVSLTADVKRMTDRMSPYPWLRSSIIGRQADGMAGGSVFHDTTADGQTFLHPDRRTLLILDGEIYNARTERQRLAAKGVGFSTTGVAELFLAGWLHEGDGFLQRLNGMFTAISWNQTTRELSVFTDRFGLRPMFYAQAPDAFVAASEVKAVVSNPGVDRAWSESGIGEFFAFGHFFSDATLFAGVRQLPPATRLVYRQRTREVDQTIYWRPSLTRSTAPEVEQARALDDSLCAAVQLRARPGERLGISLSGGLDARTILGLMPPGLNVSSVCLGIDGGIDHRSADELARISGVPHHPYVLDARVLARFEPNLRQMVGLTDGHYLDQGIVMSTLPTYRALGIDFLLRGHGGELLHMSKAYSFSLDRAALTLSGEALEPWLWRRLTAYMLDGVPRDLFTLDVPALARQSLQAALAKTPEGAMPVDRVWPLFLRNRIHRETALSMHMFDSFATVRMPFLDNDVIDRLLAMPAAMKMGDDLQTHILRHRKPQFLGVVNANTGARMGAGRFETALAQFRMRVAAKLGVKGYQPYERLGLWLRRELKPMVDQILISETFLTRRLFRPDVVRRVVTEHFSGANHTFLLMSLMCFELGQQLLEEPELACIS